jgi:hypothetical protein
LNSDAGLIFQATNRFVVTSSSTEKNLKKTTAKKSNKNRNSYMPRALHDGPHQQVYVGECFRVNVLGWASTAVPISGSAERMSVSKAGEREKLLVTDVERPQVAEIEYDQRVLLPVMAGRRRRR